MRRKVGGALHTDHRLRLKWQKRSLLFFPAKLLAHGKPAMDVSGLSRIITIFLAKELLYSIHFRLRDSAMSRQHHVKVAFRCYNQSRTESPDQLNV